MDPRHARLITGITLGALAAAVLAAVTLGGDPEPDPGRASSAKLDRSPPPPGRTPATADSHLAAELERIGAEGREEDHAALQMRMPRARAAAERYLRAYLPYEVGARGAAIETSLRRTATTAFAQRLLAAPPRLPPGLDATPPRAVLLDLEFAPTASADRATAIARLRRAGALEATTFELRRRAGRWLVAGVAG